VPLDQVSVDGLAAEALNVLVFPALIGLVQRQILDIAHAGHQGDAQQMRKPEY
jgi:hypothetical protein